MPGLDLGGLLRGAFQDGNFRETLDGILGGVCLQGTEGQSQRFLPGRADILVSKKKNLVLDQ